MHIMRATIIQVVVMISATMSVVSTNECSKLDLQIWNYKSCPHPQSNEWNSLKVKMNCDNSKDLYYHCASDIHGCDVQLCLKRAYCQADYRCMEQCPPNSFRRWDSERCYPNSTSEMAYDPMTTISLTVSHVATPGSPGIHTGMIVGIVLGSIACFIIAVLTGCYFCLQHRKNRRNKEAREDDELLESEAGPSTDDTKMKDESTFIKIENLTIIKTSTKNYLSGGGGDIILPENTPTENENNGTSESTENSIVGENHANQNSHRPGYNLPQQETQGQCIESLMSTDTESEHRPVEHEDEQHMRELKLCPESSLDESSEEVKPKEVWTPNDERNYGHEETKKKELF